MALNHEVASAVAIGNLKAISEQPAMLSNLAFANAVSSTNLGQQNAVSNQRAVSELGISTLARGSNTVSSLGPMEARAAVAVLTDNGLAETIAALESAVQAFAAAPPGPAGLRPGTLAGFLKLLEQLLKLGVSINAQGQLVVPPSVAIFIPGSFEREDLKIVLADQGVSITVVT